MFKTYIAIGYFMHDKAQNMKSIIEECRTKSEMIQDCKGNGFVAHLILSAEQMLELAKMDEVELVKTIVTLMHYTKKRFGMLQIIYINTVTPLKKIFKIMLTYRHDGEKG